VRDLETREDVPGAPLQLTIDGPLQDYAARRLGPESGAVVVMDCLTGDILAMASMPSFDPNSFPTGSAGSNGRCCRMTITCPAQQGAARALPARLDGQADGGHGLPRSRARSR
jgi:cell division protein FtsI/penicillin-binding protein 2